jgi:hypothetical protein
VGAIRLSLLLGLLGLMAGCGGGGGGGGGGNGTSLTLSASTVTFEAFPSEPATETKTLQVSWTGSRVAGFVVGTLPGQTLPGWLDVTASGTSNPTTLQITRRPNGLPPGRHSTTLRVVTGDANQNIFDTRDFTVTLDVVALPTAAPAALTWVETERPANQAIAVTRDTRVQIVSVTPTVDWVSAAVSGDSINLSGTAASAALAPGAVTGAVQATFSLGGRQRIVDIPVTGMITPALTGAASLAYEVNASTQAANLSNLPVTVTAATQGAIGFNVQSSAAWLIATGTTTGAAGNVSVSLSPSELQQMAYGIHNATLTIAPTGSSARPLQIPVSLNLRLPEVHFVAPVAFTDSVANDYVIARGAGFSDPAALPSLDGQAIAGVTVISDTELRFVPGARAAGDYEVRVSNNLGFTRDGANLRVTDPPSYANFTMAAAVQLQERVVSSPINGIVLSSNCYFCWDGDSKSTLQRFAYDAGTQAWTRTQHAYPGLYDFAFSPDESQLIVLTSTDVLLVDPATMATIQSYPVPFQFGGSSRQLAVLNSGVVIIDDLRRGFSLRSRQFVEVPDYLPGGGLATSIDGSRAMFGSPTNSGDVPYGYLDASSGAIYTSQTRQHYARGIYSRHAEAGFTNNYVLNADLELLGTLAVASHSGDLSPDGTRAYGLDYAAGVLRVFDITGPEPFAEILPAYAAPGIDAYNGGRVAIDPSGRAIFVVSVTDFTVIALP